MKKYLIISDAGSMHVYNFIKHSLLGRGYDIYILSHAISDIPERNKVLYEKNNINVISVHNIAGKEKRTPLARYKKLTYKLKAIKSIGVIDVCHIHYLAFQSCIIYLLCKSNIKKLILTYWGSDIIKLNPKLKLVQKICIKQADLITLSVSYTLGLFHKHYGKKYNDKVSIVRFVSGAIEEINQLLNNNNRKQAKINMGLPIDKFTVVLGYNADPEQHQDECIRSLSTLPQNIKDKIFIVTQLQYSRTNTTYINNIHKELERSGFDHKELNDYMNYTQIANLCIASDVYVHVRDTDASSNSMKEQLYSGTTMIQGSWLKYNELDDISWPRVIINNRSEVARAVASVICQMQMPLAHHKETCQLMWELFSPKGVRSQWDNILNNKL